MNNKKIFSSDVENFLRNELSICIDDLSNIISTEVPKSSCWFNSLFEYMINLQIPYECIPNDSSHKNNVINNKYVNKELEQFFEKSKLNKKDREYFIFDNIRHSFASFIRGGILEMYQCREAETEWYPKIIINKFMGITTDINKLEDEIKIYRGTSKEEYDSKKFGQSWSIDKEIASKFAFEYYRNQAHHQNTVRVVLSTIISKDLILYYKEDGREKEIIVDSNKLFNFPISILESELFNI